MSSFSDLPSLHSSIMTWTTWTQWSLPSLPAHTCVKKAIFGTDYLISKTQHTFHMTKRPTAALELWQLCPPPWSMCTPSLVTINHSQTLCTVDTRRMMAVLGDSYTIMSVGLRFSERLFCLVKVNCGWSRLVPSLTLLYVSAYYQWMQLFFDTAWCVFIDHFLTLGFYSFCCACRSCLIICSPTPEQTNFGQWISDVT